MRFSTMLESQSGLGGGAEVIKQLLELVNKAQREVGTIGEEA